MIMYLAAVKSLVLEGELKGCLLKRRLFTRAWGKNLRFIKPLPSLTLLANSPIHYPHRIVLHPTSVPHNRFQRRHKCVLSRNR